MWPFSHKEHREFDVPEAFQRRIETLEHDLKLIRVEWSEIYDKIVHQFERDRKRRGKGLPDDQLPESSNPGPEAAYNLAGRAWEDPAVILAEARKRGI